MLGKIGGANAGRHETDRVSRFVTLGTPEMHGQGAVNAATNEAEKGGRHGNGRVPS
jgi:hypothetical protein